MIISFTVNPDLYQDTGIGKIYVDGEYCGQLNSQSMITFNFLKDNVEIKCNKKLLYKGVAKYTPSYF